jgi:hypothetical protein
MKIAGLLILAAALVSGGVALADTFDPRIVLGPTGSTLHATQTECAPSTIGSCFLQVDSTGFGIADITNNVGATIVSDTVTIPFLSFFNRDSTPAVLSCDTTESAPGWSATVVGNSCVFTGGTIASGVIYGLNFSGFCPAPSCSTDPNNPTTVQFDLAWTTARSVPEPGTLILLGTGLTFVAAGRKKISKAPALV